METRWTHQAIHGSRVMYGQNHSQGGCVGVREGCLYRILREHPLAIVLGERNNSNVRLRKDQDSKRLVVLPVLTGMYIYIKLYTWRSERKIVLGFDPIYRIYSYMDMHMYSMERYDPIYRIQSHIEIHISIYIFFLFFAKTYMYI